MTAMTRFADMVVKSGLAPKSFDTIAKVAVAVQYGAEIGLTPIASLQSLYVTNGKVSIWGDAIPALIRASGTCCYISEGWGGEGDSRVAICRGRRSDTGEEMEYRFSVDDARAAGLLSKSGPWTQYRDRMLRMRARSFLCRDLWADVLKGLVAAEEAEDYPPAETPRQSRRVSLEVERPNESGPEAGEVGGDVIETGV